MKLIYSVEFFLKFSKLINYSYDPMDPFGNITIKWDKEVIWSTVAAQAIEQGHSSKSKGDVPHCCKRGPILVDLVQGCLTINKLPNAPRVGWLHVSVVLAATSNNTVQLPKNLTLFSPGPGYTWPAKIVPSTIYFTPGRKRKTQTLGKSMLISLAWNVTFTQSQFLVSKNPSCSVSFSSFYVYAITLFASCSCRCHYKKICFLCAILSFSKQFTTIGALSLSLLTSIKNEAQHPNLNNVTQVFSFPFTNDTGMFYGMKVYNDLLMEAGHGRMDMFRLRYSRDG
ncbi:hypothetical protein Pfo_011453 [Paulownia fortunei]|nr:hypothetical protein Pfo_011453 [Paulownia fortunei]